MSPEARRSAYETAALPLRAPGRFAVAPVVASRVALQVAPRVAPANRRGAAVAAAAGDRGSLRMPTSLRDLEIGT